MYALEYIGLTCLKIDDLYNASISKNHLKSINIYLISIIYLDYWTTSTVDLSLVSYMLQSSGLIDTDRQLWYIKNCGSN